MTSLMNLPATYYVFPHSHDRFNVAHVWQLNIDDEFYGLYPDKFTAENAAREHYAQSLTEE